MVSFFAAADGERVHASLHYFPQAGTMVSCSSEPYAKPSVAMTALPNEAFARSLDGAIPELGTPIEPAMTGAIAYAKSIAAGEGKDGKVALVLVSDGEPVGCGSSVSGTAAIVHAVAETLPTYVIGVGDGAALDDIASAGGTQHALVVGDEDPAATEAAFRTALEGIRTGAVACEYQIPAPPSGETLDRGKVNVVHRSEKGGGPTTILYDPTCNSAGWRYDDANAPARVVLCPQTCASVEAGKGEVDVLFGCATRGAAVK